MCVHTSVCTYIYTHTTVNFIRTYIYNACVHTHVYVHIYVHSHNNERYTYIYICIHLCVSERPNTTSDAPGNTMSAITHTSILKSRPFRRCEIHSELFLKGLSFSTAPLGFSRVFVSCSPCSSKIPPRGVVGVVLILLLSFEAGGTWVTPVCVRVWECVRTCGVCVCVCVCVCICVCVCMRAYIIHKRL